MAAPLAETGAPMMAELVGGREFLERYFRDCDGSNIELRALHIVEKAPSKVIHQKAYTDIEALLADAEKLAKKYNVFFNTVALNGGFSEDHAVACPALRIDVDFKNGITETKAREMFAAFPLPPSVIICTGGGLHVYWFLAEPAGREDFGRVKAIIKSLAFTFRADTGACDIPRILRLPGTVNRKPDYNPPRPVTLTREDWHPEREFSLSDFSALLPIEGEIKQPPAEKMAEAAGDQIPIERLALVFDKCAELDGMRRNAIEAGRLIPENKPGEHLARIRMMNLYRAFDGGTEQAVREIFSHLDDYNARETEKQAASLHGGPPPCAELCPAGQCADIKALGKKSPIAFAYGARRALATEIVAIPATTGPEAGVPLSVRDSAETFQLKRSLKRSANEYQTLLGKACLTEDEKTDATPVGAPNKKPEINVGNQNLSVLTKATWNAVAKANKPEYLFLLGDSAVRIEPNPNEEDFSALKSLNIDRLRGEAARAADFVAFKKKKHGVVVKVSALPPVPVIHDMLALPQAKIPLPPLSGVIYAPAFGKDGTLHVAPGYNPTTRSYYAPAKGFRVLRVSESPAELEIDLAKTLILDELLGDFPFTDEADLAHAVALFLLLFARSLIEGPTPMHLIDKPTQGTGATLLADVLTFPALGRSIAAMSEGDDEDEWRRRITAILGGGTTAVLFDNLRRPLDSGAVASAITATSWEDRKIGTSNNVHLPVQCAWIATANNAVLSGEITRRTVLIRLDAKEVQPWLRSGFRHSDLRGWARENRAKLVWAALTLIQAWLAAGRPIPRDLPSFGMFEKWASILGGVLHHVGIPGFLNNRSTLYNSSDSEGAEIRRFLNAWWAMHKDSDVGVAALWKIASSPESSLPLGDKGERSQKTRFGILLRKLRDQRYQLTEGLTVCVKTAGTMNNAAQWKLTCAV